jgi:hypothetical protein
MEVANTLAYCDTATITAVKSFIVQSPEGSQSLYLVHMTNLGATHSTGNLFLVHLSKWLVGISTKCQVDETSWRHKISCISSKSFFERETFGKVNHSLFALLVCLSVCLSVFLSVCPYVWPPVCQPACMPASLAHKSNLLYVCLSI